MNRTFTAGQLNPNIFTTEDFLILVQVISTGEGIVCTRVMYFFTTGHCVNQFIPLSNAIFLITQENDRDFKVPFEVSVTK